MTASGTSDEETPPIVTHDHQAELPSAAEGARWGRSFHSLAGLTKMLVALAKIDCNRITDWPSFHDEFNRVFQFPAFYGRNMNAWIDCMSSLDAPEEEMTSIHCEPGKVLTVELENVKSFMARCPEQYAAIIECSAFVNWRRIEQGEPAVLALSYHA